MRVDVPEQKHTQEDKNREGDFIDQPFVKLLQKVKALLLEIKQKDMIANKKTKQRGRPRRSTVCSAISESKANTRRTQTKRKEMII